MMLFNIPKMMDDEPATPGDDPVTPTVETYEQNMADFDSLVANGPSQDFPTDTSGNAITEYANDHTEELEEGVSADDETLIKNHDYTLVVAGGGDTLVKEAYETYDAAQREAVTYNQAEEEEEEPVTPVGPS